MSSYARLANFERRRLTPEEQERFRWLSLKKMMEGNLSQAEVDETRMLWRKATGRDT